MKSIDIIQIVTDLLSTDDDSHFELQSFLWHMKMKNDEIGKLADDWFEKLGLENKPPI